MNEHDAQEIVLNGHGLEYRFSDSGYLLNKGNDNYRRLPRSEAEITATTIIRFFGVECHATRNLRTKKFLIRLGTAEQALERASDLREIIGRQAQPTKIQ
jgi:hypothetical protein